MVDFHTGGSVGSDGSEKVLIGTLGARGAFLLVGVAKERAANLKNSVLASGAKHTRG